MNPDEVEITLSEEEMPSYFVTKHPNPPVIFYRQKHAPQFDIFTNVNKFQNLRKTAKLEEG
jgi:hypothetical protein